VISKASDLQSKRSANQAISEASDQQSKRSSEQAICKVIVRVKQFGKNSTVII
jgi:hypothetical protein